MKLVRTIAENYRLPYYTISPTYSVCVDHGYIAGEVNVCPVCGKRTEVYSRITGYYRPVQNWNDGKTQEWKERKLYDPQNSVLKHSGVQTASVEQKADVAVEKPILFVQDKCPNCKMAEVMLGKLGIDFDEVDATKNTALANKLQIKMTPTLVVADGESYSIYENASNIRKWAESAK